MSSIGFDEIHEHSTQLPAILELEGFLQKTQPTDEENAFKLGPPIVLEDIEFRPLTINGMRFEPWQRENEVTGFVIQGGLYGKWMNRNDRRTIQRNIPISLQ